MLEVEFCKYELLFKFLIGLGSFLFKKNIAIPTAATTAILERTIATIAPAERPLFFDTFLAKLLNSGS